MLHHFKSSVTVKTTPHSYFFWKNYLPGYNPTQQKISTQMGLKRNYFITLLLPFADKRVIFSGCRRPSVKQLVFASADTLNLSAGNSF